ncbi:MAG: NAD(P)-dependent oxidoreductase [Patescibacteria group bacterium]
MKIAYIFREDWEKDYITKLLNEESEIKFIAELNELSESEQKEVEILSLFIKTPIGPAELEKLPNLKMIAVRATGFDHIDIEACREKNITVSTVPTYGQHTVAEFTFALLLNLSRKIYDSYKRISETGNFSQNNLRGFDLEDKTLGVIGTGKIGLNVVKIALGFEMKVLAYDPFPKEEVASQLGFTYTDLDSVLNQSDILTLHAPYNQETHHLINSQNINQIKPGAYLINTARGGLIETQALITALKNEIIIGAGLDVLEEEGLVGEDIELLEKPHPETETLRTLLSNHYLIDHPRVIITPHNAFNTQESLQRILETTASNITNFIQNNPQNTV